MITRSNSKCSGAREQGLSIAGVDPLDPNNAEDQRENNEKLMVGCDSRSSEGMPRGSQCAWQN